MIGIENRFLILYLLGINFRLWGMIFIKGVIFSFVFEIDRGMGFMILIFFGGSRIFLKFFWSVVFKMVLFFGFCLFLGNVIFLVWLFRCCVFFVSIRWGLVWWLVMVINMSVFEVFSDVWLGLCKGMFWWIVDS